MLLVGWLLGGPVGIGTVISTFGAGLVMQLVYNVIHFEPRKLKHRGVIETVKVLVSNEDAACGEGEIYEEKNRSVY